VSAKPWFAVEIGGTADDAARHLAHDFLCLQARMRNTVRPDDSGTAERLAIAADDVGTLLCLNPVRPHSGGGLSTASDSGLTTPITSAPFAAPNRSAHQCLERAEKVRLRESRGGERTEIPPSTQRLRVDAAGRGEIHFDHFYILQRQNRMAASCG